MDHLAERIRLYRITNPHVFIELVVARHKNLSQMLQSQKLDLILTTGLSDSDNFTQLFEEHLNVVVAERHPFTKYKKIALKQLTEQPFIERTQCEAWDDVHRVFQEQNIQPYSVCRAENDESVLALVAANLGVFIMPVRNTPYDVRFIQIKDLKIIRSIGICILTKPLAPHIQTLYQTITGCFKI